MTQRFGTELVYHKIPQHTVICSRCGAAWEERLVGVALCNGHGRDCEGRVCPRCIPPPIPVDFVMETEISLALESTDADPVEVRRTVAYRYGRFLRK